VRPRHPSRSARWPPRGDQPDDHAVTDLDTLIELVTQEGDGRRPYLFGHSMGGSVSQALVWSRVFG
jgi:alpha-beta hydrolase superfamily lysophospholipase